MTAFLDRFAFGNRKSVAPTQTAGVHGTAIYGGYIVENETDSSLTGIERYRTFSDILANTNIAAASVRLFLNLSQKVTWTWEAADESDEAKRIAEAVEEIFDNMDTPFSRVVRRTAMYRFYGFSIQEWTAKRLESGLIGFKDIAPRAQFTIERWDVSGTGEVMGVSQRSPQDADDLYLPRNKIVYSVDDSLNDSPQGLGLLRHIVNASKRLERYEMLEGFGYETDLRGIPIGRAPFTEINKAINAGTLTKQQGDGMIASLKSFVQKHVKSPNLGLLLDSATYRNRDDSEGVSQVKQFDVELLQGSNPSLSDIANAIDRTNREIARVMGTEQLMLGDSAGGSESLSRDKSERLALQVDSTTQEIGEVYYRDLVKTAGRLNGWPENLLPKPKVESVKTRDVQEITGALRDMAQAGAPIMPDDPVQNDVRDILRVSKAELDTALDGTLLGEDDLTEEERKLAHA